jgi:hypothetical protein
MKVQHEYKVTARRQGTNVRTWYGIVAETGVAAIDFVEESWEQTKNHCLRVSVDKTNGNMFVTGWHGFEFIAKQTA